MRTFLLAVAVTLIGCVRAVPPEAPKQEEPKPEAPKPEAPKPEAPKPEEPKPEGFRDWVAPHFGEVPPAARFSGCHDPTPDELQTEKARRRIALGRALEAKGHHLLEVSEAFLPVAPGGVVRGPSGERLMGVLEVGACGPVEPPLIAVLRDGSVVTVDASPKAAKTTTVTPCTAPRKVCPPGCGARPPPTTFVAEVPPGATRRYEVFKERYALDEAVVFTPIETWRHDCPPAP